MPAETQSLNPTGPATNTSAQLPANLTVGAVNVAGGGPTTIEGLRQERLRRYKVAFAASDARGFDALPREYLDWCEEPPHQALDAGPITAADGPH